jgi:hypothetical protein
MVNTPVQVKTWGGEELTIHFECKDFSSGEFDQVWLQGNTSIVYQGQLHEEGLENK